MKYNSCAGCLCTAGYCNIGKCTFCRTIYQSCGTLSSFYRNICHDNVFKGCIFCIIKQPDSRIIFDLMPLTVQRSHKTVHTVITIIVLVIREHIQFFRNRNILCQIIFSLRVILHGDQILL